MSALHDTTLLTDGWDLGTIYGLRDPRTREIRYVGKTVKTPQERLDRHLRYARCGNQSWNYRWLRALLAEELTPEIVILERDPVGGLDQAERAWIAEMRRMGCRLTNATDGGTGGDTRSGAKASPETLARRSASLRGRKLSIEHRQKLSERQRGKSPWNKGMRMAPNPTLARKLVASQIPDIHDRVRAGESVSAIARDLGVSRRLVRLILDGKAWRHAQPKRVIA